MRAFSILAASVALLSPALADFYVYNGFTISSVDSAYLEHFYFWTGPPDCNAVTGAVPLTPSDDVSGDKEGVRCEGCSASDPDSADPTELEFNEDFGHYTWYANRDGALVDVDGNVVGNCHVDKSDSFDCTDSALTKYIGFSQIFCDTDLAIP
ncbi:hypothetical protein N0V90_012670 [Kalmusia sp. IMI 367209]|nr:hypothetical protein N0V90_012670 [Kalmusia sp. IMI 367209]